MKPTIFISAGGTGGHIFPALALAKHFETDYRVIWVGCNTGLEQTLVPKYGYKLLGVAIKGFRNGSKFRKLAMPFTLLRTVVQCIGFIIKYKPVAVIGFGGYATFPICAAAKLLRKPVFVHEQNSVAGLTNKLIAKIATKVFTGFPGVLTSDKTILIGNPVRNEIVHAKDTAVSNDENKLRILVVGGSLGAKVLNETIPLAINKLSNVECIFHQIGRSDINSIKALYKTETKFEVVNFIDKIAQAYKEADLIICRAGASTVAEVAACGIAAIFVPYPSAVDDHQTYNAKFLSDNDAAILLPQTSLSVDKLVSIIDKLDKKQCQIMAARAKTLALLDSDKHMYEIIHDHII